MTHFVLLTDDWPRGPYAKNIVGVYHTREAAEKALLRAADIMHEKHKAERQAEYEAGNEVGALVPPAYYAGHYRIQEVPE